MRDVGQTRGGDPPGARFPDLGNPPDGWPAHRITEQALASGTEIRIRPALPSDEAELKAGIERLSERTRWLRFHAPVHRLTEGQVRWLVDVDHHDREALVAEIREGPQRWQPMAVARWYRDPDHPTEAEIAIVVEDAYQGRGVGRRLLARLAEVARDEEDIEVLTGEVLAENRGMLSMLDHIGVQTEAVPDGPVVHTRTWLRPVTTGPRRAGGQHDPGEL